MGVEMILKTFVIFGLASPGGGDDDDEFEFEVGEEGCDSNDEAGEHDCDDVNFKPNAKFSLSSFN